LFALFERIADAEQEARRSLLEEIGRDDPELRARIERLLALDASERDLAGDVSGWRERLGETDAPPERLGAWRIVREIGAGGMGRVFLAERCDGEYEQTVALKVVRGEFASDAALARFLAERRILARLDHPNIAALVDGGVDARGRPWFAMRYVDGLPLPEYCTTRAPDLDARLGLVVALAEAAAYAHRQLVVHCDLKPSNVLVDANGEVHVLDFGIARLIDAPRDGRAQATETQLRALTPGYAAPEQLAGKPPGIATDVYAIGAMLYEVLTGKRPYAGSDETPSEVAVAQSRGEPASPSRIADSNGSVPARRLRGDLDAIVATALRHDVAQRYPDAAALADDLRAFLSGRPLRAQRTSALHRARKFAARHRTATALAAAAVLALIATAGFALRQSAVARREAAEATAARDFLVGIFRSADPREGKGGIDTRTLIDRGSAGLEAALATQPDLAAGFAEVLGNVYLKLAAYDDAEKMLDRALALTRQRYGDDAARNAPILRALATTRTERNQLDDAGKALAEARAIDAKHPSATPSSAIDDDAVEADLDQRAGALDKAGTLLDRAVATARTMRPAEPSRFAALLNQRANVAAARGALDDAERDTREALAIFRRQNGEDSLDAAENLVDLGVLSMRRGDAAGAEPIFREGLAAYRRLLPGEHPLIADAMTDLARALDREGKSDEAEPLYLDALAMQRRLYGDAHGDVATTLNNLAVLYVGRGDYSKARAMMQEVVAVWTKISGSTHPLALASRGNLGVIEREQGDHVAARATLESALDDYRKLPDSAARQAYCLDQLGILLRYEGKNADALALHRQADALRAGVAQLGPVERAAGLIAFSLAESANGDGDGALAHANAAVAALESAKAQGDARYADALVARARASLAKHDLATASKAVADAAELRRKLYGADDWRTAETDVVAAEIDAAAGDRTAAIAKAEPARAVLVAKRGAMNPLVGEADLVLGKHPGRKS
jgi:serine/threonine-protein kinase